MADIGMEVFASFFKKKRLFFFEKKNALSLARGRPANPARKRFFLKKEAKTFVRLRGG
jgi:hypothetical protein